MDDTFHPRWEDPDLTDQVADFLAQFGDVTSDVTMRCIVDAVDYAAENGPMARRPVVGEIVLEPDYREFVPIFGRHLKELAR